MTVRLTAGAWLALLLMSGSAAAQEAARPARGGSGASRVRVVDLGPGSTGRLLRAALARPHVLLRPGADSTSVALPRGASYPVTVIVLHGDATVASAVHGDVIVVGGDLFLRPGAIVDGRAVAIGGGVYHSTLALVRRGRWSYRDHTFAARAAGGETLLAYRALEHHPIPLFSFPLFRGVRLPLYDRVNGASVAFGPLVTLDSGRFEIDPTVTYRSHLGALDAGVEARAPLSRRTEITARARRGTFTNDAWIRGDLINSVSTLVVASDARNYFRADRAELLATRRYETTFAEWVPFVSVRTERDWPVGPLPGARHSPWSAFGRRDTDNGMLRPNPAVHRGRLTSAIAGATARWEGVSGILVTGDLRAEGITAAPRDRRFVQGTFDGGIMMPVVRDHTYEFLAHAVVTAGDSASPQRYVYLGGPGTLPTLDLLSMGGDQLFFVEQQYTVPFPRIRLPLVGSPAVGLRHMIGSAGVERLPRFVQNVGLRVTLGPGRVDFSVDPESGDTDVRFGLSVTR